jgi:hypothetical protein
MSVRFKSLGKTRVFICDTVPLITPLLDVLAQGWAVITEIARYSYVKTLGL